VHENEQHPSQKSLNYHRRPHNSASRTP
jgi:hypothetical protein